MKKSSGTKVKLLPFHMYVFDICNLSCSHKAEFPHMAISCSVLVKLYMSFWLSVSLSLVSVYRTSLVRTVQRICYSRDQLLALQDNACTGWTLPTDVTDCVCCRRCRRRACRAGRLVKRKQSRWLGVLSDVPPGFIPTIVGNRPASIRCSMWYLWPPTTSCDPPTLSPVKLPVPTTCKSLQFS